MKQTQFDKLLENVIQQFQRLVNGDVAFNQTNNQHIQITIKHQARSYRLNGIVAPSVTMSNLGTILSKLAKMESPAVLLTNYVNPRLADRLKEMNVYFIDSAGNSFLNLPTLFVFTKGNKKLQNKPSETIRRIWRPAGLRIIFVLLSEPGLESKSFRLIAQKAGVALGSVAKIMQELKEMGFLIEIGKNKRILKQKKELLERWVMLFPDVLRPKLILGKFKPKDENWWINTNLKKYQVYWSGEVAAWLLTKYLKPQKMTVYVEQWPNPFLIDFKMQKDADGSVEVLKKFWHDLPEQNVVPPILVYADLLATGDPRNIEVGNLIYEKEIAKYIG